MPITYLNQNISKNLLGYYDEMGFSAMLYAHIWKLTFEFFEYNTGYSKCIIKSLDVGKQCLYCL